MTYDYKSGCGRYMKELRHFSCNEKREVEEEEK